MNKQLALTGSAGRFTGLALRTHGRRLPAFASGVALATLLTGTALAGGADVSTEALYSDDVVLSTWDGQPLDIDGDGTVDLAIASNQSGAADRSRYYPGNGDGTFGEPVLLSAGASSEVVAGDLNGDMFLDLIQGRRDLSTLHHLGDGMAVADGVEIAPDADRTLSVALGDLDDDGDLDVVTGNGVGSADMLPQPNRFYLNNIMGSGTLSFTGADISPDADVTRSIVLADIDGDGDLDVLAGNDETTPGSNRVYLNLFDESGSTLVSFGPGLDFGPADDQTSRILVGDLDNDGDLDVVTLNFVSDASPGVNRFFINSGTFGLEAAVDISADTDATSGGALADFDGDGNLDLAVANLPSGAAGASPRNRLYLNQVASPGGPVSFAAGIDISADEHTSRELAARDINGDDAIDIVVGNQDQPDRRYLNNGTADPFTNVAPTIDSQETLGTNEGEALTIVLEHVSVTDPDNVFPDDFTLTVQAGTNYTVSGNTVTPDAGFAAPLLVPVIVNDGTADSAAFSLEVSVTPAPRSGGGGGGGAAGILALVALLGFIVMARGRRASVVESGRPA